MAGVSSKLSESKYHNWVKAALAVLFTKEGIEPFVYDEIQQFQWKILSDICYNNGLPAGTTCSSCCTENVKKNANCPNNICYNFKREIQRAHRYNGPSYNNTDASKWCSNPWEVAKCFMPPEGYKDVSTAADTDFNGINSVVINYRGFQAKVHDNLSNRGNIFEKGRQIGRDVRHSPNLEVDDVDLQQYFTDLHNLLSDPGHLAADVNAQNAKKKLTQLQNDTLIIGKENVKKVLDDVARAVQDKIRTEIDVQKKAAEIQKLKLLKQTENSVQTIEGQEEVSLSNLHKALKEAVEAIKAEVSEGTTRLAAEEAASMNRLRADIKSQLELISAKGDEELEQIKKAKEQSEEEKYNKVVKDLQTDLITYYREIYQTLPISPCVDEVDVPLVKFFVPPYPMYSQETDKMKLMKRGGTDSTEQIKETEVNSLSSLFYKHSKVCKNIYVTAEPGLGKTSFLKWLLLNWCQAHCPIVEENKYFKEEDVSHMKKFELLFLIFLRGCTSGKNHIDDMIEYQIVPSLARHSRYTRDVIEKVLFRENSLIVLDGLDEWTSSDTSIPQRSSREKCTYLTTSRPWKFYMLSLKSKQIDQHIEIKNLAKICTKKLIPRVFSLFEERKCLRNDVVNSVTASQEFIELLKKKKLQEFQSTPIMLLQMMMVWNMKRKIGNSHCKIYSNMVGVLFTVAKEKGSQLLQLEKFKKHEHTGLSCIPASCKSYFDLMLKVGGLAFDTLFSESKESTLVFDEAVATKYLTPGDDAELGFCLQTGLLSKRSYISLEGKRFTNSFYHNTIQEYFAALFIQSAYDSDSQVSEVVKKKCNSVSAVLEMGTVFKFLSGFNPSAAIKILQSLQTTISSDKSVELYRNRGIGAWCKQYRQIKAVQDMVVGCVIEATENGHREHNFPLEDIIIDDSCLQDPYCYSLKTLIKSNLCNIKSLAVHDFRPSTQTSDLCEVFGLTKIQTVIKFEVDTDAILEKLHGLLSRSAAYLKCLSVESFVRRSIPWLRCNEILMKTQHLETLYLNDLLVHSTVEKLLYCITHQISLRSVTLCIDCIQDRDTNYSELQLHLCQHRHLLELTMENVPLSKLELNEYLQKLSLENVPLPKLELNEHLQELRLGNVPLPKLELKEHLQELSLKNIPLLKLELKEHLQELRLENVPLPTLELNEHLQNLSLENVPLRRLELNERLQELSLNNVPLLNLELNGHLQELRLENEHLPKLELNEYLQRLSLENVALPKLDLNDNLQRLRLDNVPLTKLELNEQLQDLGLANVLVSKLELKEHLQELRLDNVPLPTLELNEHLQNLRLGNVPLRRLELNERLQELSLNNVPLLNVERNGHLQELRLENEHLPKLELNEYLQRLSLENVALPKLDLNDNLQRLRLDNVPLTKLELNDQLQDLGLANVLVSKLELNEHLQELRLENVPLQKLELNEDLHQLSLENKYLSKLVLNEHLQELSLENVPLPELELNEHLQRLSLENVPLPELELNEHLQELSLTKIPLPNLELNEYLQELILENVPISNLELNEHLQELSLENVPLQELELNEHLQRLSLENVPLPELELNEHLQKLSLTEIPLPNLELNEYLQELILENVPIPNLELNEHLQELTLDNGHLSTLELNEHLQNLRLANVPLPKLELNEYLRLLTLRNVPLPKLELNDHLQELTLDNVPLPKLELNEHLRELSLTNVPLPMLELNEYLQKLRLTNVPLPMLELNEHLRDLTLWNVPLPKLELNEHLRELTIYNVPLPKLDLNTYLQELRLENVPLPKLELNEHLQNLSLRKIPLPHSQTCLKRPVREKENQVSQDFTNV